MRFFQDVTEHNQNDEALRESEERHQPGSRFLNSRRSLSFFGMLKEHFQPGRGLA